MLPRKAVYLGVAVAIFSAYLKLTGTKILKTEAEVLLYTAYVSSGGTAQDAFILYAGRAVFFVIVAVWLGIIGQSTVAAFKRYRRRPITVPPLQPLAEDERSQLAAQQQEQPAPPAAAGRPSSSGGNSISPQQQQEDTDPQRSSRVSDLDERRQRALDALQRDLEAKAAAHLEQQKQEEAQRSARQAAAAQAAAQKAAEAAAAAEAARAAEVRHWDRWERSVMQTWGSGGNLEAAAAGAGSSSAGGGNVPPTAVQSQEALHAERQLRQEQDAEFHASLEVDRQKRQRQQQQESLRKFKQALQQQLSPDAAASSDNGGLTVRVRLPDGTSAVRYFAASQSFTDVQEWVFSLPAMPLLAPGSWQLASSFPKRTLQSLAGIWAPGGYSRQALDDYVAAMAGAGTSDSGWNLTIRSPEGDEVAVHVRSDMTVLQVKEKVEQQTGLAPEQQHLIFAGQVLQDTTTLQQYNITADHRLQLMPRMGATPSLPAAAAAAGEQEAAVAADADVSDAGVLVVHDVQQLKDDVAHGASQLALYVVGGSD